MSWLAEIPTGTTMVAIAALFMMPGLLLRGAGASGAAAALLLATLALRLGPGRRRRSGVSAVRS